MTTTPPPASPAVPVTPGAKTNVLAIVALILGIVVPIGGIICGPIALGQIKRTGEAGRGLAMAGLILGIVFTLVWVIFWIVYVVVIVAAIGTAGVYSNY